MTSNPFASPGSDDAERSEPASRVRERPCPACGEALEPGSLRSGMSIDWHVGRPRRRGLVLTRPGERVSQRGFADGAVISGYRCAACGLILSPGNLD